MGFLRRLFAGPGRRGPRDIDPALTDLLETYGLATIDRQLAFQDRAGTLDWELDQDTGTLALGPDLRLPAQLIGSMARTWRWAWANESVTPSMAVAAGRLRAIGEERGIAFLTQADVDEAVIGDGHTLMLGVTGLLDADAYYRCPYRGGEAFVTVSLPAVRDTSRSPEHVVSIVTQAIGTPIPVTARSVAAYLRALGIDATASPTEVAAGDGSVTCSFDELGRLVSVKARSPA